MKVTTEEIKHFAPFSITITFDNEEETVAFYNILNCAAVTEATGHFESIDQIRIAMNKFGIYSNWSFDNYLSKLKELLRR